MTPKVLLRFVLVTLLLAAMAPLASAAHKRSHKKNPALMPWGTLTQNKGCVIFAQHRKTRGMYWGVAVTTERYNALDVVETIHYTMPRKHYRENQDTLNKLENLAVRDRIKFVNIPGKVTPQKLEEARHMCRSSIVSDPPSHTNH